MKSCVGLLIFLLTGGWASAQDQLIDNLQLQYQNYQSNNVQEKLFVHTDKTFYLAGETVWFKVYALDASFHKPLAISSVAYIEILNKDLKPVVQSKVAMSNGNGNGSFILPGSLSSGNYIFRAYSSWMKNFPPDFYYEQTLHIVNTQKLTLVPNSPKPSPVIQFFPEGGTEVSGFAGKIAFKATDGEGRGVDCQGLIVNNHNDTISRFQSLHNGMGNFQLKPEKNSSYYAVLKLNDTIIKQKLPDANERGFIMNVTTDETGKLNISVFATPDFNNTKIYLFAHTRQVVKNVQSALVKEGTATFVIDKKDLGDGISAITLFNSLRQPVCERLVFKRPRETLFIQSKTDQPTYTIRKPVNVSLNTGNSVNSPLAGNLSMSVLMIYFLLHIPEQNIVYSVYPQFRSERQGTISRILFLKSG